MCYVVLAFPCISILVQLSHFQCIHLVGWYFLLFLLKWILKGRSFLSKDLLYSITFCENCHVSPNFSKAKPRDVEWITEMLGLEEIYWDHLVWPKCTSRASWTRLPRTMSTWLLSISTDGDSTTCPSYLFQFLITLLVKKCIPMVRCNFWGFSWCFYVKEVLLQGPIFLISSDSSGRNSSIFEMKGGKTTQKDSFTHLF